MSYYNRGFNNDHGISGRYADGKRRVFTSSMVAHTWANQSVDCGRNGKGSMYFNGATIYSYGEHWPLATITDRLSPSGQKIVVVNTDHAATVGRGWGNSTNRHLRYVLASLSGHPDYVVIDGDGNSTKEAMRDPLSAFSMIANQLVLDIHDLKADLCNMRKAFKHWGRNVDGYSSWAEINPAERAPRLTDDKVRDLCQVTQIALPVYDLEAMRADINEAVATYMEGEPKRIKDRAARAKRECLAKLTKWHKQKTSNLWTVGRHRIDDSEAWHHLVTAMQHYPAARWEHHRVLLQQRALICEMDDTFRFVHPDAQEIAYRRRYGNRPGITLNEWLTGKLGNLRHEYYVGRPFNTLMRKRNGRLETTQGVEVPWQHAVVAFRAAIECNIWQRVYTPDREFKIGHFKLDRIDADGTLHAGCHHLQFKDMLTLACVEEPDLVQHVQPRYPVPAVI